MRIPLGFDIYASRDLPLPSVAAIVLVEIAPRQRAVVAVAELDRPISQPGVVMRLRIPEVQVRIGDRKMGQSNFPVTRISGKLL
jgi:hypothetical protein